MDLGYGTIELISDGHLAISEHDLGLKNYGICYVNAVLQSLMATRPLMAYLHRHLHDDDDRNEYRVYLKIHLLCTLCAPRPLRKTHDSANISSSSTNDEFVYSIPSEFDVMKGNE